MLPGSHGGLTPQNGRWPYRNAAMLAAMTSLAVLAQNTVAFQGGQQARDYLVVSKQDIATITTDLTASLSHSEQAALTAQLSPGEAMITPTCTPTVTTDHQTGEEAVAVTVTVAE